MSTIQTNKPDANRFKRAKNFAENGVKPGDDSTQEPQAQAPATSNDIEKTEAPILLRAQKKDAPTVRENFDVEEDLSRQMRRFISSSSRFRTKREFLTQCLVDGLKKYEGQ